MSDCCDTSGCEPAKAPERDVRPVGPPPKPGPGGSACCGVSRPADVPTEDLVAGEESGGGVDAQLCCGPSSGGEVTRELPGYRVWPFVRGWLETPVGSVPRVQTALDGRDVLGRWEMRWGIGRDRYRIAPGLYAVGTPGESSPVLVTANYKMTFDALRKELAGVDAWVLVLETHGINVWCAAGKGTFGTEEVIRRVAAAGLGQVVSHRKLVLPQLGAPGVSAHEVKAGCGFSVVYGPVYARDLRRFLGAGMQATPAMRRVEFSLLDRLVLTPVELTVILKKPSLWAALGLLLLGGIGPWFFSPVAAWHRGLGAIGVSLLGVLAGAVLTPALLPRLPWNAFSAKGALVGVAVAALLAFWHRHALGGLEAAAVLLAGPAVASYCAMNFTGATPYTSPSGVEREMRRALPWQAGAAALAVLLWVGSAFGG